MDKKNMRNKIRSLRNQLTVKEIEEGGRLAAELLCQRNEWRECDVIYLYASFQSEVSTEEIMKCCFLSGKRVGLPRVIDKTHMYFYEVKAEEGLEEGCMGIMEPKAKSAILNEPGLMLLPGLVFDSMGNRIGYGGGYYDRYLSSHYMQHKIGLAYSFQIIDKICADALDEKVDGVITIPFDSYDKER